MLTYIGFAAVALTGIAAFSYYRKSSSPKENNNDSNELKTSINEQQHKQTVIIPIGQQTVTTQTTAAAVEKPTVVVTGQIPSTDNSQIDMIGERLKVKPQAIDTLNVVSKKTASGRIVSPRRKNVDRAGLKKAIQEAEQFHVAEAI